MTFQGTVVHTRLHLVGKDDARLNEKKKKHLLAFQLLVTLSPVQRLHQMRCKLSKHTFQQSETKEPLICSSPNP